MTDAPARPARPGAWLPWALWLGLVAVLGAGGLSVATLCRAHFWEWWGSQPEVIDRLAAAGRWTEALARVERLSAERPWDPRPVARRADLLRDQAASRGVDPLSDPAVAAALEAAVRSQMVAQTYPMLLSPSWRREMADSANQLAGVASRQRDWRLMAFCLSLASDLDPAQAPELLAQLRGRAERRSALPPELLEALVRMVDWHEGPESATAVLDQFGGQLGEVPSAALRLELECERPGEREPPDVITRMPAASEFPPQRLLTLRWWQHGLEWSGGRWHPEPVNFHTGMNVAGLASLLAEAGTAPSAAAPVSPELGWALTTSGSLDFAWPGGRDVGDTLWLVARGSPVLGVWPVLEVQVNASGSQLLYIRSRQWQAFEVLGGGGRLESLKVAFLNDGGFGVVEERGTRGATLEDRNVNVLGLWTGTHAPGQSLGRTTQEDPA